MLIKRQSSSLPETMEYGQFTVETLDEVAPRLRLFVKELIKHLEACEIRIETTTVYLLNSTDHPIEVMCSANGVPIEMNFDATMPVWATEPRARLHARFNNYGRRHYFSERRDAQGAKLPMTKVLKRFLGQIYIEERKRRIQSEKQTKAGKAREAFEALSQQLGVPIEEPDTLLQGNLKIKCLPKTPTQVLVMLVISYPEAVEITQKYFKP